MITLAATIMLHACTHGAALARPLGESSLRVTSVTRDRPLAHSALGTDEPKAPPSPTPPTPPAPPAALPPPQNPTTPPPASANPPVTTPIDSPGTPPKPGLHELFPGVHADLEKKFVEFDGVISPMLVKDEKAPAFFLETVVCAPNTREHESFVVTSVKPSHIHAALLAVGLNPGSPGSWTFKDNKLEAVQPTGDRVTLTFVFPGADGKPAEHDPLDWIIREKDRAPFLACEKSGAPGSKTPGWLFTGSKMRTREGRQVYDADGSGTIVGLTSFGSEVISWSRVISPDASIQAPEWIADFSRTPPAGTKLRVQVKRAE